MDFENDDSSDELHIDEGREYRRSNNIATSRGIHNAYSSNTGAFNDARLSFGSLNDAAISKPDFGAGSLSSYTLTGHPKASTKFKASKRSRNYYEKSLEHSGNIVSEYYRDKNVGRTTAEQDVSSSVFFRSNSGMAFSDTRHSFHPDSNDGLRFQGTKRGSNGRNVRKGNIKRNKSQQIPNLYINMNSDNYSVSDHLANVSPAYTNTKRQCPKITHFIQDRQQRLKSYFRRRIVPFKRTYDMNLQCGTSSLLIQISDDIQECLYHGDEKLVELFLDTSQGLRLSHVHQDIQQEKSNRRIGRTSRDDMAYAGYDSAGKKMIRERQLVDFRETDDDFYATVKEKDKKQREKKKEIQQRILNGDFLSNISERNKAFRSRKDALINKMSETDEVCATKSFLVIINHDNEAVFYHGHPSLTTKFFTTGLDRECVSEYYNTRMLDPEEFDQNSINTCSVPQCVVTRNSLSKWRLAAITLYNFPAHLPMTLYTCSEKEKERWIAELDLNPAATNRIAVCSLHFKDGEPTEEFPLPTELLSDRDDKPLTFRGTKKSKLEEHEMKNYDILENCRKDECDKSKEHNNKSDVLPHRQRPIFSKFISIKKKKYKTKSQKILRALQFQRKKRLMVASSIPGNMSSVWTRKKNLALFTNCGSKIQCRFCFQTFKSTAQYIQHVKGYHLNLKLVCGSESSTEDTLLKDEVSQPIDVKPNQHMIIGNFASNAPVLDVTETKAIVNSDVTLESSPVFEAQLTSAELGDDELGLVLRDIYPNSAAKTMNPKKKYVCAVCKSVCDLFGLFTHMKTVHKGLLCQYCLKLFKKVADLEIHLKKIHNVFKRYYHNKETFQEYSGTSYTFACTACSDFISFEQLEHHRCNYQNIQFDCPFCDQVFGHQEQLELHIANGWCKEMKWMLELEHENEMYLGNRNLRSQRLAALTGRRNNQPLDDITLATFEAESRIYEPAIWKPSTDINLANINQIYEPGLTAGQSLDPNKCPIAFNPWDRNFLQKFSNPIHNDLRKKIKGDKKENNVIINDIPKTGSIFFGSKSKGITHFVASEGEETRSRYDLEQKFQDATKSSNGRHLKLDDAISRLQIYRSKNNFFIQDNRELLLRQSSISAVNAAKAVADSTPNSTLRQLHKNKGNFSKDDLHPSLSSGSGQIDMRFNQNNMMVSVEDKENSFINNHYSAIPHQDTTTPNSQTPTLSLKISLPNRRESKAERMLRIGAEIEIGFSSLRSTLDYFANDEPSQDVIEKETEENRHGKRESEPCLFCQQARIITIDAIFVYSHLTTHDSETTMKLLAEDPRDAISRLKKYFKDSRLQEMTFQYSYSQDDSICADEEIVEPNNSRSIKLKRFFSSADTYNCCCCSDISSATYDQLLEHLSANHDSKVLTCQLCQNIFLNYGSFISHVCYGPQANTIEQQSRAKFSCRLCDNHDLQTFLDFQHHFRKYHNVCEICLLGFECQQSLYDHCQQHSNELMCIKCFRSYDDQQQFRKHLYFDHHSEHDVCKSCYRKTWPHVYHFCLRNVFGENICEVCDQNFDNLQKYRVHFRTHTGTNPYTCTSQGCTKSYISKHLLNKHIIRRHPSLKEDAEKLLLEKRQKREMDRFGATEMDSVAVIENILNLVIDKAVTEVPHKTNYGKHSNETICEGFPIPEITAAETLANLGDETLNNSLNVSPSHDQGNQEIIANEYDPVDAAVRSIMDIDSMFNIKRSPVKGHSISLSGTDASSQSLKRPHGQGGHPSSIKATGQDVQSSSPTKRTPTLISFQKSSTSKDDSRRIYSPSMMNTIHNVSRVTTNSINSDESVRQSLSNSALSNVEQSVKTVSTPTFESTIEKQTMDPQLKKDANLAPTHPPETSDAIPTLSMPIPASREEDPQCESKPLTDIVDASIGTTEKQLIETISSNENIQQLDAATINTKLVTGQGWDVDLSESSDNSDAEETMPKKARTIKIKERALHDVRVTLRDHDYCFESYLTSVRPPPKPEIVEDLSEMDKILSNVAMGASMDNAGIVTDKDGNGASSNPVDGAVTVKKHKKNKKNKKKKKKRNKRKSQDMEKDGASSSSDSELDVVSSSGAVTKKSLKHVKSLPKGPKPKFHTPTGAAGITAAAARPNFSSSEEEKESGNEEKVLISPRKLTIDPETSDEELVSSDLDTDFSADDLPPERTTLKSKRTMKPSAKVSAAIESRDNENLGSNITADAKKPVKLKIKLPTKSSNTPHLKNKQAGAPRKPQTLPFKTKISINPKKATTPSAAAAARRQARLSAGSLSIKSKSKLIFKKKNRRPSLLDSEDASKMSEKMRKSLALNRAGVTDSDSDNSNHGLQIDEGIQENQNTPERNITINHSLIDTKVYCYCQSPHDDVSEMIGCDAPDCKLEWFHFECVGIMVPPEGQWFCPECSKKYQYQY